MASELGAGWRVIEEGHPSRTPVHDDPVEGIHKNGRKVLPALLESHRPLDLVIVMLGTNDLKMRYHVPAMDIAISVEKLLLNIATSFAGPAQKAPRSLLVAPVPIVETGFLAEMFDGGAAKSQRLAGYFAAVAERQGAGFVDAGSLATVDPVDGIHLSETGHRDLGVALASAVQNMFN